MKRKVKYQKNVDKKKIKSKKATKLKITTYVKSNN